MSITTDTPITTDQAQREALEDSERRAAKDRPKNYKEEENDDKVVEIGPDLTDDPIKGIDPEKQRQNSA
jgi:hypothetical protein